jgi:hypothetical protein
MLLIKYGGLKVSKSGVNGFLKRPDHNPDPFVPPTPLSDNKLPASAGSNCCFLFSTVAFLRRPLQFEGI